MKIYGIATVRDEEDILETNVLYHLAAGFDRLLILDNGSQDGTAAVLRKLARDPRITWTSDDGEYRQAERLTELAQEAFRQGADWVVPIDADEFWYPLGGSLRRVLREAEAGALEVEVRNFVQSRHVVRSTPHCLEWMVRRIAEPIGPFERELVEAQAVAYIEGKYPPKWISRPTAEIEIHLGNHSVDGVAGPRQPTADVICLHVPLRSRAALEKKADDGERIEKEGWPPGTAWHVRRWARLRAEDGLDGEWAANSYSGDSLDVYGVRRRVVFDATLLRSVAPFLRVRV